jgi:hypothetical protein
MAANRTFLAMTTGRLGAPMEGLRLAQGGDAGVHARAAMARASLGFAGSAADLNAAAVALSLSLQLPIGCRA